MSETKIAEKKVAEEKPVYRVLGVFRCVVQAYSGRGTLTVLVRCPNGSYRLYGRTNLVTIGVLAPSQGKLSTSSGLADALSNGKPIPVFTGREQCLRALTANKVPVEDISPEAILEDVKLKAADKGATRGKAAILGL